jgi:hypothetical protein
MAIGASEEWQRAHANGWVAAVWVDTDGTYHYLARDTAVEEVVTSSHDTSADLQTAQKAADALIPVHDCDCPRWADVSAKVLVQAKCSANHDIAATFTRRELRDSLSAGTFAFYCERCNTYRVPTDEEREGISRRLDEDTPWSRREPTS